MTTTNSADAGRSLTRAAFASFLAASRNGHDGGAAALAERLFPADTVARRILSRGAVAPMGSADLTGALTANATGAFLASLAPLSAGAQLINGGLRVSLSDGAQIALPLRASGAVPLSWVPEGAPIPVRSYGLNKVTLGPAKKAAAITVHSRELAKQPGAEAVFTMLLREDAAVSLDAALFATTGATDAAPAGLLNGVTAQSATAGGGLAAMEADLVKLATAVTAAGGNSVIFIAAPAQAEAVAIRKPEIASRVTASAALAAGTVIAIDAAALVSGFGDAPDVESSHDATLHMDNAPAQVSTAGTPNVAAAPSQSMFQAGLIATRIILDVAFALRHPGLVAYLTGATW